MRTAITHDQLRSLRCQVISAQERMLNNPRRTNHLTVRPCHGEGDRKSHDCSSGIDGSTRASYAASRHDRDASRRFTRAVPDCAEHVTYSIYHMSHELVQLDVWNLVRFRPYLLVCP